MRKPWYWKARKHWYVTLDNGKQVAVGDNERKAYDRWREMTGKGQRVADGALLVDDLFGLYVKWAKKQVEQGELTQRTLDDYASYFDAFSSKHGRMFVSDILPHHVTDWMLSRETWGPAAQAHAIRALNRAFNWATAERRIEANPIRGIKIPRQRRRETLISEDEHKSMVLASRDAKCRRKVDKQFGLVLVAIRQSGGRTQDVANVRVEHVNADVTRWTIPEHKRLRHTGQPRVVYLSPCLQTVTRILMQGRKSGPLFRGRRGAMSTGAITTRVYRLRSELGLRDTLVAYSYRHTFVTNALTNGVDVATVAELVGTSVTMIQRNYGHLCQRDTHMRNAARKAVGG